MAKTKPPLDDLVKSINKKYGEGTLLAADQAVSLATIERLPSRILSLDLQSGGGFPRGRISMLKGDFSTGKSVVCLMTAAEAQRTCRHCGTPFEAVSFYGEVTSFACDCGKNDPMRVVWLDSEHSFDSSWARKWGVDTSLIYVIETEYAEQAIDVADACIRSKKCDLLVVDSIAALTPGVEVEESVSEDSLVFIRDRVDGHVMHVSIERAHKLYEASKDQWETLAYTDEDGFCWRLVTSVWRPKNRAGRKLFEVKTSYGKSLKVTGDHSVYRLRLGEIYRNEANTQVRDGTLELVKGSSLEVGDYLLALRDPPLPDHVDSWDLFKHQYVKGNVYNQCHLAHPSLLEFINREPEFSRDRSRFRVGAYGPHVPLRYYRPLGHLESISDESLLYYMGAKACAKVKIPAERIAYLIGAFLGDGYINQDQIIIYVGNVRHEKILNRIKSDLEGFISPEPELRSSKGRSDFILYIGCRPLGVSFSFMFGKVGAKTKRFPMDAWNWPERAQRSLIEGWLDTDGHIVPDVQRAMITTTSKEMALDGVALLANLGVDAGIQKRFSSESVLKDGRTITSGYAYIVTFSMRAFKGDNAGHNGRRNPSVKVPFGLPVKVTSIKEIETGPVYDMEVEGASNFVANGILVHNSSEKWQMGVLARLINKALRKWTSGLNSYGLLESTKCTILLINQLRVSFGGYHPTITSPGGRGLDFFESLEVRFKKNAPIEEPGSKRPIGISVEFSFKKNKTAPLGQGGLFSLYFVPVPGRYTVGSTDIDAQVLQLASFWGLIKKGGAWYTFPNGMKAKGKEAAASVLKDSPELLESLTETIIEKELVWQETGELGLDVEEDEEA